MKMPRLTAELGLLELGALSRLRAAIVYDVLGRLPAAIKQRTSDRGSSGDLRTAWKLAMLEAKKKGFKGEDQQVVALATVLGQEADEVGKALLEESKGHLETAGKVESVMGALVAPASNEPPG